MSIQCLAPTEFLFNVVEHAKTQKCYPLSDVVYE